ncbi:hypothetical protein ACR2XM_24765 [Klebsiella pneumoniae]
MSEFSRETLLNIIETDHVQCGEASALARIALAAMDSETVEMPLDYLQGHKDGLEWAARLAEANHPDTGDWLYDDPIELAKAIRKGPDMPPVQPVADSEPVIVVGDDGGDALSYRRLIQSFEPGTKLYRHAQQPVVPEKATVGEMPFLGTSEGAYVRGWNDCRAAMLQELKKSAGTEAICRSEENVQVLHANPPVIPDGSASMLRRWLAFGRGMQNAGSQLPRNLIAETEGMLAATPQHQNAQQNIPEIIPDSCTWYCEEDINNWHSDCGYQFQFMEDGPEENGVKFCPKCGKSVAVSATEGAEE